MVSRKAGGSVNEILNLDCNLPVCDTVHSGRWISAFRRVRCGKILCIFGLFNNAVNVSDCTMSDDSMNLKFQHFASCGRGFCGLICDTSGICMEGLSP